MQRYDSNPKTQSLTRIDDLRLPSSRLEALKGTVPGSTLIRINDRWRVCFRFAAGDAFDVEITDNH
jgi:proteic killer suppression protein